MSAQITSERFVKNILALLEETFEQVHGIFLDRGTSLFETIEKISAEEASRAISTRGATVASHVGHVRRYLGVLERYIQDQAVGNVDWQATWQPKTVDAEDWIALQNDLRETYRRVHALMDNLSTWDGDKQIGGALAIVVHTAYHLGSIRHAVSELRS
jgi:hypothetical protein